MRVFLSWSGRSSRTVAEYLRDWLPSVLQAVKPWMSSEDIGKGARWSGEVSRELEQASVGILCVTRDNQHAPWLQFEAGALSKIVESSFVIPYLLDVSPADLSGPLVQFQAAVANELDTLRMVQTINRALGENALTTTRVEQFFGRWWPDLEGALARITDSTPSSPTVRPDREILEELLGLVRDLSRPEAEVRPSGRPPKPVRPGQRFRVLSREIIERETGPVERALIREDGVERVVEVPLSSADLALYHKFKRGELRPSLSTPVKVDPTSVESRAEREDSSADSTEQLIPPALE